MLPVSLMSAQILQEEGVAYDVASWSWIGKLASEARLYLAGPGADFATIAELRAWLDRAHGSAVDLLLRLL